MRGIYEEEADADFREVATFSNKAASEAWWSGRKVCTNPDYAFCEHIYTTLCDWEQVVKYLLTPLAECRLRYPTVPPSSSSVASNVFLSEPTIRKELADRLDLPFHASTNEESTLNTLRYLFFHMKCGIFCAIRKNRLVMFVPFVNKDYRNTWSEGFPVEFGSIDEYEAQKVGGFFVIGGGRRDGIFDMLCFACAL